MGSCHGRRSESAPVALQSSPEPPEFRTPSTVPPSLPRSLPTHPSNTFHPQASTLHPPPQGLDSGPCSEWAHGPGASRQKQETSGARSSKNNSDSHTCLSFIMNIRAGSRRSSERQQQQQQQEWDQHAVGMRVTPALAKSRGHATKNSRLIAVLIITVMIIATALVIQKNTHNNICTIAGVRRMTAVQSCEPKLPVPLPAALDPVNQP